VSNVGASTAHMIAVLCMQVVREDPGLMVRLQELAKTTGAPFEADHLTADVVELAEGGVTMVGQSLLTRRQAILGEIDIPVPRIERGLERSAGALAVGSFTTEYIHTSLRRLEAFDKWMHAHHPTAIEGAELTKGAIEDADTMLTLMAHVAGHLTGQDEDDEPEAVHDDSI
jgi:hypothetical protein